MINITLPFGKSQSFLLPEFSVGSDMFSFRFGGRGYADSLSIFASSDGYMADVLHHSCVLSRNDVFLL